MPAQTHPARLGNNTNNRLMRPAHTDDDNDDDSDKTFQIHLSSPAHLHVQNLQDEDARAQTLSHEGSSEERVGEGGEQEGGGWVGKEVMKVGVSRRPWGGGVRQASGCREGGQEVRG